VNFLVYADFDSQVSIFTGGCDMLSCVKSNDESPLATEGVASSLSHFLEMDVIYQILVSGYSGDVGNFSLEVRALEVAENDICTAATELQIGTLTMGSTVAALEDDIAHCGM
jgi:hypothetical protein